MNPLTKSLLIVFLGLSSSACKISKEFDLPSDRIQESLLSKDKEFPENLHLTQIFKDGDPHKPEFGVIPFDVKVSLWSDEAKKRRYIFIPSDQKIGFDEKSEKFVFPVGTTFIKHFSTPANDIHLETRIATLKDDQKWYFTTYLWNESAGENKKSTFPVEHVGPDNKEYRIPSEKECKECHQGQDDTQAIIGFQPSLLNFSVNGKNEIDRLQAFDLFSVDTDVLKKVTPLDDPLDEKLTITKRVRSYAAVNCGTCHHPKGIAWKDNEIDLRYSTSDQDTQLVQLEMVVPGKPDASELYIKLGAEEDRMPPLNVRVDPIATDLFRSWIEQWSP